MSLLGPDGQALTAARRNSLVECGLNVGTMAIRLKENQRVEYISFPCTKPKNHRDACEFVGVELVVSRRRRT